MDKVKAKKIADEAEYQYNMALMKIKELEESGADKKAIDAVITDKGYWQGKMKAFREVADACED